MRIVLPFCPSVPHGVYHDFFEGLTDPSHGSGAEHDATSEQHVHGFLMTSEGLELAAAFPRIVRSKLRRRILDLVRALSDEDEAEPA